MNAIAAEMEVGRNLNAYSHADTPNEMDIDFVKGDATDDPLLQLLESYLSGLRNRRLHKHTQELECDRLSHSPRIVLESAASQALPGKSLINRDASYFGSGSDTQAGSVSTVEDFDGLGLA